MIGSGTWSAAMLYYHYLLAFFLGLLVAALIGSIMRRRKDTRFSRFIVALWHEKILGIMASLTFAAVVGLVVNTGVSDRKISFAIGVVAFMLAEFHVFLLWDRPKGLWKIEEKIDEQLGRLSAHRALWTDGSEFDSAMRAFHDEHLNARAKQVIATFVARKLQADFGKLAFVRSARQYSDLAAELIPHCRSSIYYTLNLTPKTWFQQLLRDEADQLARVRNGQPIDLSEFLPHIMAWSQLGRLVDKRRLVVLSKAVYAEVRSDPEERLFMKRFLEMNKTDTLRFAELDAVCEGLENPKVLRLDSVDYGIYNGGVVLKWEGDDKPVELDLKVSSDLLKVFDFDAAGGVFKTPETIRKEMGI